MQQYLTDSARTVSDQYHLEFFSPWEIARVLQEVKDAGDCADQVKKALFYGREPDMAVFNTFCIGGMYEHIDAEIEHIDIDILHSVLGTITEAAELADLVIKAMKTGEDISSDDLIDETGDDLWYIALRLRAIGTTFEEVAARNIRKLCARFPEKFDETRANVRNLDRERKASIGQ